MSIRAGALDNLVTLVWKYSQHQPRHASIAAIMNSTWKKILAFKNVKDIGSQPDTTKFQDVWLKSNDEEFSPDTPVSTIMAFISALLKKKEARTKSADACYVFTIPLWPYPGPPRIFLAVIGNVQVNSDHLHQRLCGQLLSKS